MSKYVLLTGATGLVGRYLIRDFLLRGTKIALVIRPAKKQSVQERAESIIQRWETEMGRELPRPVCLEGDVAEPEMALSRNDRQWIANNCDRVLHNAAVLTFYCSDRTRDPWRTNLDGTKHMLALCEDLGLRDLHYVSTAYVSGMREGVVMENELDCGQTFRNDYEHSKFLAEQEVRAARFLNQLTVYRPAVIAGDSQSGYTSTYHGLYMYLQLVSVICRNTEPGADGLRHTNIRLNMTGDEPRNIIPVDWVSAVITHLFHQSAAHGRTYHLAPDKLLTPRQIVEAGYKYFNSCGVEFCGKDTTVESHLNPVERAAYENKTMYEPYEQSDPTFDTTNLKQFAGELPCPTIDEGMLHRFWQYGEEDRWGRRREAEPVVECWAKETLHSLLGSLGSARNGNSSWNGAKLNGSANERQQYVHLDLTGPGGGQWTVTLQGRMVVAIEDGLFDCGANVSTVRMSASQFVQKCQNGLASGRANGRRTPVASDDVLFNAIWATNAELNGGSLHNTSRIAQPSGR